MVYDLAEAEKTFQDNRRGPSNYDLSSDDIAANPDKPNPGDFSDNTERLTRDKNEIGTKRSKYRDI